MFEAPKLLIFESINKFNIILEKILKGVDRNIGHNNRLSCLLALDSPEIIDIKTTKNNERQ